ncbi:hypothetical protein ACIO13_24550 [Streptomyces sp. NPDC087425]|uniref:hypothetical protein n=1 Tax=Streptomyces sp. NPDC087425 TaxID=3365787 RepID=UPI003809FF75
MRAGRSGSAVVVAATLALGAFTAPPAEAASTGIKVWNFKLNNGKPIIVGTTAEVTPDYTFTVQWPSGSKPGDRNALPYLYHGTTAAKGAEDGSIWTSSVTYYDNGHADGELYIEPRYRLDSNNDATTWKIAVLARIWGKDGHPKSTEYQTGFGTVRVKRAAKVTVNASPEPVVKGKKLTVTGRITRADWVKHAYTGFAGRSARLQFRKAGTSTYTNVRTVKASSTGALKTTVTAAGDGYWRWTFGETDTTGGATAAGDYVDVK